MASILPIAGTVAGSYFGPVGGAVGGALGSLAANYINKGSLSGGDAVSAVGSGVAGYAAGGGFDSVGSETPGAVAGPGTAAASSPTVQALGAAASQPITGSQPPAAAPPTWNLANQTPPPPTAPSGGADSGMPNWMMPNAPPTPGIQNLPVASPTSWMGRDSGLLGLTHGQALGYGGLGALGLLGSGLLGGNGAATIDVAHPTPVLSRTPTNRRFTAAQPGYRPGHDPEHSYFAMARGGRVRGFYDGGGAEVDGGKGEGGGKGGDGGYGGDGGKGGGGGSVAEGGGYQGGGGDKGGGSFGGSIGGAGYQGGASSVNSGSGMSSVGSGPGPVGGGDPWGAGISNTGYSGGLDAGSGPGMGGSGLGGNWGGGGGYSGIGQAQYGAGAQGPVGPLGPQMATLGINRHIIQPAAGYRPGFSPEHTFIQTMADGGIVTTPDGRTVMTTPDGARFVQKKTESFGLDRLLGIPGLMGAYASDNSEWVPDGRAPPVLATTPIDRGYTPAPAGYRPGHDPEWTYFHDPVPAPKGMDEGGPVRESRRTAPDWYVPETPRPDIIDRSWQHASPEDRGYYEDVHRSIPAHDDWPIQFREDMGSSDVIPSNRLPGDITDSQRTIRDDPGEPYRDSRGRVHHHEMAMADGGIANAQVQGQIPGYIRGDGDGVSDSIRGTIDGREPVDLSTGEFVIPARTVSGLGNGSSEAGARKLHRMMQRVDQARARMAKGGTVNDARVLPA